MPEDLPKQRRVDDFLKLTADQVKDGLRKRHPATALKHNRIIPGAWTCLEEYEGIDFLAISATKTPPSGGARGIAYPWIGYEVKISRSDMRTELLKPSKRSRAQKLCNQFFFATPKGMLTDEEKAYREPDWEPEDFIRQPCEAECWQRETRHGRGRNRTKKKSKFGNWSDNQSLEGDRDYTGTRVWQICPTCKGLGYSERSRVEREAPTLWIPRDVGLVEIDVLGAQVARRAPITNNTRSMSMMKARSINKLVRWVSLRPDPRHKNIITDLSQKK